MSIATPSRQTAFRVRHALLATAALVSLAAAPAWADMYGGAHGHNMRAMPHAMTATSTQTVSVDVKRPQILRLSRPAASVIVGDPTVADVAVHSTDTLLVLGRSYGTTNVIAMDTAGRVILDSDIHVSEHVARGGLRIHNGDNARSTYHCTPNCLPSPSLGDDPVHIARYRQGAPAINNNVAVGALSGPTANGQNFGETSYGEPVFDLPPQPGPGGFGYPTDGGLPPGFTGTPPSGFAGDANDSDS